MTDRADALRALLFASTAAGMLMAGPALAEEPAGPDGPQDATTLGTVTVTGQPATREPESPEFVAPLVDTPRSVTIIPQQIIEQTAATSLQDILRTSPGITFGAGEGGQPLADRPFIRGQSSGNNIFVDGVRDSGGQQREVFNLEQVEVIKGPDAVYSGRGSGGGSINLSSKAPRLTDFTRVGLGGQIVAGGQAVEAVVGHVQHAAVGGPRPDLGEQRNAVVRHLVRGQVVVAERGGGRRTQADRAGQAEAPLVVIDRVATRHVALGRHQVQPQARGLADAPVLVDRAA